MITLSLIGGLGNQMFQYAAGKALAERHSVGLALDVSGFQIYARRSYLLNRLCVPEAGLEIASEAGNEKPSRKFRSLAMEAARRPRARASRFAQTRSFS